MTLASASRLSKSSIVREETHLCRPARCPLQVRGFRAKPVSCIRPNGSWPLSCAAAVEWLADAVGARIALVTAYKHVGHSVPRLHAPVSRRGQDLVDDLLAAVEKRGLPLAVGNDARALLPDGSGG